jgi:NADH-quinone oxidoreductase subunit L
MEFFNFGENPGNLYVVATLLPLLSFVLLLLVGAVRALLRTNGGSTGEGSLYHTLGGDKPGKTAAYIATGAIAGSFVLCLIGFIMYSADQKSHHGGENHGQAVAHGEGENKDHDKPTGHTAAEHNRWSARVDWARVLPAGLADSQAGTILQLGYKIDHLSTAMFLMVTFIATLIHLFSIGYMSDELAEKVEDHQVHTETGHLERRGRYGRFFMFLSLFCFSMLNLVLADNLFQVFLSWELVGICSYLLIGFYYERTSAANAANKAFITNRVGDAGFIIGLLILWTYVGTLNFDDMFTRIRSPLRDPQGPLALAGQVVRADLAADAKGAPSSTAHVTKPGETAGSEVILFPRELPANWQGLGFDQAEEGAKRQSEVQVHADPKKNEFGTMPYWLLVAAGLGVFLGCVGKSAQFPLQVWLPDAMEGPTPVSALIHAATMVAAGVYLVGRCYPLFVPESRLVIAYVGGITLFVAASIAIVMTDIKKVLAYSTVSQLGYMMLALGVGGWVAGLFHLITHAFFKALLFLGSGSVIFGCHHEQEMTKMGGLKAKMPITAYTMLMGVFAIMGFPCSSGWYSKDAILANALGFVSVPGNRQHFLLFLLPLITAGITTFYMFRMWFMTFTGKPRDHHVYEHAHESPRIMTTPLIILAIFSIVVAWGWPIWDAEASALEHHLHHAQHPSVIADLGKTAHETWQGGPVKPYDRSERIHAEEKHSTAGGLAIIVVFLGFLFAWFMYYRGMLDPAEAYDQFPGVYRFLQHKWYFDEFYSAALVRPSLTVAHWFRAFDTYVIDGIINFLGRFTVLVSRWDGLFDTYVVDGLVNLTSTVVYAVGGRARRLQTGYLRSYVLFLVLAAVSIFALLSYFVARVMAY